MIYLYADCDFVLSINLSDLSSEPITDDTLSLTIFTKEGEPLLYDDGSSVDELTPQHQGEGVYTVDITSDMAIVPNQPYFGVLSTTDQSENITTFRLEMIGVRQEV